MVFAVGIAPAYFVARIVVMLNWLMNHSSDEGADMSDLIQRLRSGVHNAEMTTLAGVKHDTRSLEAADEIERLRWWLEFLRAHNRTDYAVKSALSGSPIPAPRK